MGFKEERFRTGETPVPPEYIDFCDERYDAIITVHDAKGGALLDEACGVYAD